jgi:hydroxyacylglutathione hydrolase
MEALAEGVFQMKSSPLSPNVYLVGRTVVDSGVRRGAARLVGQLRGRQLDALVLTHVHPPTQGGSAAICDELGLELWCGEREVRAAESGELAAAQPKHWFNPVQQRLFAGPGRPVARRLRQGDRVEGFEVLDVPGHAPGHVALWRERDGVLLCGDVLTNQNVWTGVPGLREPPVMFTPDPARNRESARRIAALRPALTLFSHGRPLRDPAKLERFVRSLPA